MKAVLINEPGGPEQLRIGEYETPTPTEDELLVKVHATALNRADTMQRAGNYPPPEGASPILGLELAGIVEEAGSNTPGWQPGDRVMALLSGGGYAEYAAVHHGMAMAVPPGLSLEEAAAIPEVFLTAFQALYWLGDLQKGERVLIHAGASGVGTAAIQLVSEAGAHAYVTASAPKHDLCLSLGAEAAINYKEEDFAERVLEETDGRGVDLVLDFIGAPYFGKNLRALATDGRFVLLSMLGGRHVEGLDLAKILRKRVQLLGTTLRARAVEYKKELSQDFAAYALPLFMDGALRPVIHTVMDWTEAAEAHRMMEANENAGKIVLRVAASSGQG